MYALVPAGSSQDSVRRSMDKNRTQYIYGNAPTEFRPTEREATTDEVLNFQHNLALQSALPKAKKKADKLWLFEQFGVRT